MSRLAVSSCDVGRSLSLRAVWLLTACVSSTLPVSAESPATSSALTFEQHVRPILKIHCFHCHGEDDEHKGGLDLRLVRLMRQGGDSGPTIIPGDPNGSILWEKIATDEMPDGPKKLSPLQKQTIQRWIQQGASTARPEPANVQDAKFSVEELSHWAFQPIRQVRLPKANGGGSRNAIDLFIARRLREKGLNFSPRARRATLLRRVSYDLRGLLPTPEEVARFTGDRAPNAYERLVDEFLASPQFGIRWGRHWLDVAGYAETNGDPRGDTKREYAWRYRDYVIAAVNASKPIDEFFCEQLAGDELIEGELDVENNRQFELLSATGFLRMAPDATQSANSLVNRNAATAESLKVVSSALLGLTVGCAQCHDHKYDPIGIDDYYRFRAIFDPVFPLHQWQQPSARLVDFTTPATQTEIDAIEAQAKVLEDDWKARRRQVAQAILERKFADVPEKDRQTTRDALATDAGQRTPRQRELLDLYPMVKPIEHILGLLVEYDGDAYRRFQKEAEAIAAIRAKKPSRRMLMATRERPHIVPTSHVFFRGNPDAPRQVVSPGELSVVTRTIGALEMSEESSVRTTTGRRLAYARYLTSGRHPLAARVFVNRIWQHHMGSGIVRTPNDFGISGERPTHPELLDWLADDFMKHGWDAKRLHRLILLSTTYQQVAQRRPMLDEVDPENELWGRANLRRLEAEVVRDTILQVSEQLDLALGGASVPVTENAEGKVVVGRRLVRDGLKAGVDRTATAGARRSVFVQVQRRLPLNVLATFDQPEMTPNCDVRPSTTVAMQSLWLLNDASMVDSSQRLADVLLRERSEENVVDRLFVRLFGVEASADEERQCEAFLVQQRELMSASDTSDAEAKSLAALGQVLMASNRFLYID